MTELTNGRCFRSTNHSCAVRGNTHCQRGSYYSSKEAFDVATLARSRCVVGHFTHLGQRLPELLELPRLRSAGCQLQLWAVWAAMRLQWRMLQRRWVLERRMLRLRLRPWYERQRTLCGRSVFARGTAGRTRRRKARWLRTTPVSDFSGIAARSRGLNAEVELPELAFVAGD